MFFKACQTCLTKILIKNFNKSLANFGLSLADRTTKKESNKILWDQPHKLQGLNSSGCLQRFLSSLPEAVFTSDQHTINHEI
jgi:hypothetical protein